MGDDPTVLDEAARDLAATLVCQRPAGRSPGGLPLRPCGTCGACQRATRNQHPDITWLRPESKSRQIAIDPTRELSRVLGLRASEAAYKVAIIADADRMTVPAANAFLKTLEEPSPGSVILLLTTQPDRLLETILSRCLRLTFASGGSRLAADVEDWVQGFAVETAGIGASLLARYRLLENLLGRLAAVREEAAGRLEAESPLARFPDAAADQKERWEEELKASAEAEYRRRRAEFALGLEWWLRDLCLVQAGAEAALLRFPPVETASRTVADRIPPAVARANLDAWQRTQRLLFTNVQEALALEVGLLGLRFHAAR